MLLFIFRFDKIKFSFEGKVVKTYFHDIINLLKGSQLKVIEKKSN